VKEYGGRNCKQLAQELARLSLNEQRQAQQRAVQLRYQQGLARLSNMLCARLANEEKQNQSAEEIWEELSNIRERIANNSIQYKFCSQFRFSEQNKRLNLAH